MKLTDLDQRVIVPVVDESQGGMRYEIQISIGELLKRTLEDFEPAVVDAVPVVHGRWIDENPDDSLDPRMRCSICTGIESPLIKWRYCPNCGALMNGDGEART